jgi:mannose-1-phosphate guanylyltransferase
VKAVILVGGKATRLMPLTTNTPKAMVPVLNTPFLEHVIRHLRGHGIKEIVLAQGHLAGPIESFMGNGKKFGVKLSYSIETTPLGTAGAVKNAQKYVDDRCLVLNGDIFTDLDITAMLEFHRAKQAMVTIALTPVEDPSAYGLIETDAKQKVTRFLEKPSPSEITTNNINAGTYILEPEVLERIAPGVPVSFEREVFPGLLADKQPVFGYSSPAYWIDIGTPAKYLQLHQDLLAGKAGMSFNQLIGKGGDIHPGVRIEGPVAVGENCTIGSDVRIIGPGAIGPGCKIEAGVCIRDSVIWQNTSIGARVQIKDSIIADKCIINADSTIESSVLGDGVAVPTRSTLKPGTRLDSGVTFGQG